VGAQESKQELTIKAYDATIIGSGPNGLSAAITLARAGYKVRVIEGRDRLGGGCRTRELTLPGFQHDVCAAIHPLGIASPFFRDLPLSEFGMKWIQPTHPLAHPLDDGTAVVIRRSVSETAAGLEVDAGTYRRIMGRVVRNYNNILVDYLGPLRFPSRPIPFVGFGMLALMPATGFARLFFKGERARAVFSGMAAHSILPLTQIGTASFGLLLGMLTHAVGWPLAEGGSQNLIQAMTAYLESLGGVTETGRFVSDLDEALDDSQVVLLDTAPKGVIEMSGEHLPGKYKQALGRFRYGPGVFKLDLALSGPVPWTAPECREAGTVHVGGRMEEIVASEAACWRGEHPHKPYVLVAQTSLFDRTRVPGSGETLWTYCHVPNGSTTDMSEVIEAQIERFAPGFRKLIIGRSKLTAAQMGEYNPNYVGGDINAGVQDLRQLFTRPVARFDPYSTPNPRIFLCSSSTPPGGGVHGMCGFYAARSAMRRALRR
jgi:phytoene dehydrogenase-like protein